MSKIEYDSLYALCQAYADYCNENDLLHGRTDEPNGEYYLYFVSGKISGRDTRDTVTMCFTGARNKFNKYPSYMIQTS